MISGLTSLKRSKKYSTIYFETETYFFRIAGKHTTVAKFPQGFDVFQLENLGQVRKETVHLLRINSI